MTVDCANRDDANERTMLLPRHDDVESNNLGIRKNKDIRHSSSSYQDANDVYEVRRRLSDIGFPDEKDDDKRKPKIFDALNRSRYVTLSVVVGTVVLCVAAASRATTQTEARVQVPVARSDDDNNNGGDQHVYLSQQISNLHYDMDARVELWDEWKRHAATNQPRASTKLNTIFQNHVETAQQIIQWEQLGASLDNPWEQGRSWWQTWTNPDHVANMEHEAQHQLDTLVQSSGAALTKEISQAQAVWNNSLVGVENEPWWQDMSSWFQSTWLTYSHEAHDVWVDLKTKAAAKEKVMWNQTMENERVWYANSITNMRRLGDNMQNIWQETEVEVVKDEAVLQQGFKDWWNKTKKEERVWWKNTRHAYHDFSQKAHDKEQLWWHMVQHSTQQAWNETEEGTVKLWKDTEHAVESGWEATEQDAQKVWNGTVQTEDRMWHAVRKWFHAHATYTEELSLPLLYLNHTATFGMLMNGYGWYDYSKDFFLMQQGWDAQINQAYCAVASSAAVLNSLRGAVELPIDPGYQPYPYATQLSLLANNTCVNENVVRYNASFDGIFHSPGGLSLTHAKNLLECHLSADEWQVDMHELDPETMDIDEFRRLLTEALKNPMARVIVNYDRKMVGQAGGGHFSPVGSYYETEDRFLIMDVAKYKYPAAWVPAARLYASLATVDICGDSDLLPQAQDNLPAGRAPFENRKKYLKILTSLGCKSTFRGFLIVRPNVLLDGVSE